MVDQDFGNFWLPVNDGCVEWHVAIVAPPDMKIDSFRQHPFYLVHVAGLDGFEECFANVVVCQKSS